MTLVVTINQSVLSQELGFVGTERKRMSDAMNFRDDAEDVFGATSPPEPEAFLQALVENTADLSRRILYTAIPAITVTGTLTLYLAPELFSGTTLGVANPVWVVSAGATAGFVPFLVLAVYVLQLATIAKRTLAIGPFILRSSERESEIEPE